MNDVYFVRRLKRTGYLGSDPNGFIDFENGGDMPVVELGGCFRLPIETRVVIR